MGKRAFISGITGHDGSYPAEPLLSKNLRSAAIVSAGALFGMKWPESIASPPTSPWLMTSNDGPGTVQRAGTKLHLVFTDEDGQTDTHLTSRPSGSELENNQFELAGGLVLP